MKNWIIICLFVLFITSCETSTKNKIAVIKNDSTKTENINKLITEKDILLDSVEPIDEKIERKPEYINQRINNLTKTITKKWIKKAGFENRPDYILFRVFKYESVFEIWVGNNDTSELKLINTFDICALQATLGPKLKQKDNKSAEGFYTCSIYYTSPSDYMFIKLTNEDYKFKGVLNYGSCFKIMINYPNEFDSYNSLMTFGTIKNGGTTAIHGNCCSLSCISFENPVYIVIFSFALMHNIKKYGLIQTQMFPCRFDKNDLNKLYQSDKEYIKMDSGRLFTFWNNIKIGYDLFESKHKPIRFRVSKNGYSFN